LQEKGLIKANKVGVKILGQGKLTKKLTVRIKRISSSAQKAITKAGGQVIILGQGKKAKEKLAQKEA